MLIMRRKIRFDKLPSTKVLEKEASGIFPAHAEKLRFLTLVLQDDLIRLEG